MMRKRMDTAPPTLPGRAEKKARPFRRKRRAWLFKIYKTTKHGITGSDLLASLCHRYSTVRNLVVKPASSERNAAAVDTRFGSASSASASAALVEVRFAGPQPSESCGALLCLLLGGESVQAWPVELPRGRKRKNSASTETNNDDPPTADAANAGPLSSGTFGVPGVLPPPPIRRRDSYDEDLRQQPPQEHGHQHEQHQQHQQQQHHHHHHHHHQQQQQRHQHQQHQQQQLQQHQQQQQQPFGTHSAAPDGPNLPFPAVQAPLEARPVEFELAGHNAGGGGFGTGAGGPSFSAPAGLAGSASVDEGGGDRVMLRMEDVMVKSSRRECDFEGRPLATGGGHMGMVISGGAPIAPPGPADDGQCHLVFTGLEETGHDLDSLRVTALFGVDAVHQTATVTGPLQVGADGRVYSSVFYPSLQEIWPELHASNVQVVEVDIEVEILCDGGGEYRYAGPQLKVIYHRAGGGRGGAARGPSYPDDAAGEFRPIYSHPGAGW